VPKTYRSPVQDIAAPIMGLLFLALALTPLLTWPGRSGEAGKIIRVLAAILAAGLGLAMIVLQAFDRLLVTADGLTYRYNLRTRRIPGPRSCPSA
jgi:hypothetical protein